MKYFVILVLMAFSVFSNAQTTIKMEKDAGIYKVGCKVNGAPMKMYFDTGATVVSISRATAIYLYDNDLISKEDFIGKMNTTTAEGAIVDNMLIRLKDVEIGGLHLKDVEAVVTSSLNAPLLLGQSVISRLGKITLNGNILTIHASPLTSMSKEERANLDNKIRELRASRFKDLDNNYKILDIISKIEKTEELNEYELFCKLVSESNEDKHDDAMKDAKTWIEKYAIETDSIEMKMRTYFVSAKSNLLSENGNKELGMQHLNRCSTYFINDSTEHFYWHHLPNMYYAYCKYKDDGYTDAIHASKISVKHFLESNKMTLKQINNNESTNSPVQFYFQNLAFIYSQHFIWLHNHNNSQWTNNEIKTINLCTILAAKLGSQYAKDYCNQNNLDYKRKLTKKELDFVGIETN